MRPRNVFLSWEFLSNERLFGKMVRQNDQRALDIYLALLRACNGKDGAGFPLDYEALARAIGLGDWPKEAYRRQINKTLKKLQRRYGLLEIRFTGAMRITIKPYALPQTRFLKIPHTYWGYGWSSSLSLPAKAMLILNFAYSPIGPHRGRWQASRNALVRRHHLSNWIVSRGTTELRRKNLLDVEYAELDRTGPRTKQPHIFVPQPLYDPGDLARKLRFLEKRHGAVKLNGAQRLATLVYEDCDAGAMEALIALEERFGARVVRQAAEIVAAKSPSNPKRCMGYLIRTIEGIGRNSVTV
jgi:hypothetical protein